MSMAMASKGLLATNCDQRVSDCRSGKFSNYTLLTIPNPLFNISIHARHTWGAMAERFSASDLSSDG